MSQILMKEFIERLTNYRNKGYQIAPKQSAEFCDICGKQKTSLNKSKKNPPQINADQRRNNLRNSATSAGNKKHPSTSQKKNPPQINADQRRNNLRNSATSAGNKKHPSTSQKKIFKTHKKISCRLTPISGTIIFIIQPESLSPFAFTFKNP
jgi:hypothetical protein